MSDGEKTPQEASSAGQVGWGDVAKKGRKSGSGPRSLWSQVEKLKMKDQNTQYKVRIIGNPYQFFKLYEPIEVTLDPDYDKGQEVFTAGNNPSSRYCVWVFDRNDGNKIKLFENGPMIFRQFGNYMEIINEDPGGENGPDWSLSFTDPIGDNGQPNPRLRKYSVMHIKPAPFTEEEQRRIAEHIAKYPYNQVIKGSDSEYITKLWEEAKSAPEGAKIPGSFLWYRENKDKRDDSKESKDVNLDTPKAEQPVTAQAAPADAAPAVETSAAGDGFEETFNTGKPAEGGAQAGGTSLF